MNVLFLVNHHLQEHSGVKRKILEQVKAIETFYPSSDVYLTYLKVEEGGVSRVANEDLIECFPKFFPSQIFSAFYYSALFEFVNERNIKVVYIRYTQFSNFLFVNFLKDLKRCNVEVILEIPTYPYDNEVNTKGVLRKLRYLLEKTSRTKMVSYVDKLVTFTEEKEIFGKPTISISNAAPIPSEGELSLLFQKKPVSVLNFVCVARLEHWHGYDRLLKSLYNSENKSLFHVHVVGDGPELRKLINMSVELNIENYVTFHGSLSGLKLTEVLSKCHIGVDSLGRHRSGNLKNSSLKSKEYLVSGLPVVYSHDDSGLSKFKECCFKVDSNDLAFDLEVLVSWYRSLRVSHSDISKKSS